MYRVRTEDKRWHTAVYSELDQKLDATGFHRTYYKGKLVDCDYGPAIVGEDGEYEYVYRGLPITKDDLGELRHIDMKFEDVGDKPSVVFRCRKTKAIHRVHGPAIIQSGCRYFAWYQNGRLHRVNGFAEEFTVNGRTRKRRVVDGRLSGWGEPAVVAAPRKEYWSYGRKILKKDLLKSEVAADYNYECYIVAYNAFKRSVDTGDHTAVIDLFARLEDGSLSRKAMALGAYHAYVFTDEEPLSRDGDEFEDVMNSYLDSDASIYIMDKFSSGGRTDYLLYLVACYISKLDASAVFTSTQNEGLPRAAQLASGDILFENEVRTAIEFYHALDPLDPLDEGFPTEVDLELQVETQPKTSYVYDNGVKVHLKNSFEKHSTNPSVPEASGRADGQSREATASEEESESNKSGDGFSLAAIALGILAGAAIKRVTDKRSRIKEEHEASTNTRRS